MIGLWDVGFGLIVLLSAWRGFRLGAVSDLISTVVVIGAAIAGLLFAEQAGQLVFGFFTPNPSPWAFPVGFIAIFVVLVLIGGIVRNMVQGTVSDSGMKPTDRTIGLVFGIVRGLLLVLVVIACAMKWLEDTQSLQSALTYAFLQPFHSDVSAFVDLLVGSPSSV